MDLFDNFDRPIKPTTKPDERVLSVASIEDRFSDYPSRGLTPQKLAAIFKEADQGDPNRLMQLFEEMEEKDTHLFSILQKRRGAVSGLDYQIVPFTQDKLDLEVAEFIDDVITRLPDFEGDLKDIVDAIGKGYSALELHWAVRENRNVIRKMERVEPKRFTWAESHTPRLLTKEDPSKGIDLPPFKFLFNVHKTKSGHPTRQGVLRVVAWMYLFKNYDIKGWVKFSEVFGMPLRLGKYEAGASKEDKDALIMAVRSLGSDAAGIISKGTEIEFIEAAKNSGTQVFKLLADFCNAEMSKAVLGQTMTTEQGANGARSLGEVHKEVEGEIQCDDCEQTSKAIRRDIIRPLVGFNFGWEVPLPWFKFDYEDPGDLKEEADRYKIHLDSGVEISVDHYYEKFKIPKPEKGDKLVGLPVKEPLQNSCPSCGDHYSFAHNTQPDPEDTPGPFVDRLIREAPQDDLIEAVEALLNQSKSLEEFRDRMIDAYPDMDILTMGNKIQEALETSDLAGRWEALPEDDKK